MSPWKDNGFLLSELTRAKVLLCLLLEKFLKGTSVSEEAGSSNPIYWARYCAPRPPSCPGQRVSIVLQSPSHVLAADADAPRGADTPWHTDVPHDADAPCDADTPCDANVLYDADAPHPWRAQSIHTRWIQVVKQSSLLSY